MKKFNVAVIGAGDMGTNHVRGWRNAGHNVVSITDYDLERARKLAENNDYPKIYSDYKEAINDSEVDIVSICLPLVFHAPVTIYAAERGKHVFCEKPLASSPEDAAKMEEAVNKAGVQFGIGFQRNFAKGVAAAKQWAEEGKFGKPLVFNSDLMQEVRPKIAMHDNNGNKGPIMDACCHYFFMWQTVFQSKPKRVYARGGIIAKDRPEIAHFQELAIDTGLITVEFESGDIGSMNVSWGLAKHTKLPSNRDRVYGPKGGAVGGFNNFGSDIHIDLYIGDKHEKVVFEKEDLFETEFRVFAKAIEEGKKAPVGFKQGKEMLQLTYAIFESIKTGKVIELYSEVAK